MDIRLKLTQTENTMVKMVYSGEVRIANHNFIMPNWHHAKLQEL